MTDFTHEEIEDARMEAHIEAQEEYEDEREEFTDYLRDKGPSFGNGFEEGDPRWKNT